MGSPEGVHYLYGIISQVSVKSPSTKIVQRVYVALAAHYGYPAPTHPRGRPLNVLVETILSQHTSDKNSRRAFVQLRKRFPQWNDVANAEASDIEDAIRSGGLARQKSVRIQQVLRIIKQREGRITLARLKRMTDADGYDYLTTLPGIGGKTACCVLLFALGRNVMPVDTHIQRITRRLGWIQPNGTADAARSVWEARLPANTCYHAHVLLIAHGRQTCLAQRPRCTVCPLRRGCPAAD